MASNPAGKFKLELTPLPTRVSRLAVDRLNNLRDYDGMTIQEHVRRAVDEYLDRIEAKYQRKLPPRKDHPLAVAEGAGEAIARAEGTERDPLVVPARSQPSMATLVTSAASSLFGANPAPAPKPKPPVKASKKNPYSAVKAG